MGIFSTIANIGSKILPFVGNVVSKLPIVGDIAKGIGSLFGGKTEQITNKISDTANMAYQGMQQFNNQGLNAAGQGFSMINAGRRMFGGIRDAFRAGDFNAGMSAFNTGMQSLYDRGQDLMGAGRSIVNTGRSFLNGVQSTWSGQQPSMLGANGAGVQNDDWRKRRMLARQ